MAYTVAKSDKGQVLVDGPGVMARVVDGSVVSKMRAHYTEHGVWWWTGGVWGGLTKTRLLLSVVLAAAALCTLASFHPRFPGDTGSMAVFQTIDSAAWLMTMYIVTDICGGWFALLTSGLLGLVFFLRQRYPECLALLGIFSVTAIVPALKEIVDRPRPSEPIATILGEFSGTSFPSGHSTLSMVLFGLIFYLAPRLIPDRRAVWGVRLASVIMVLLGGMSRVYLGVHWPSDVMGGYVVGAVVLALLIALHRRVSQIAPQRAHAGFPRGQS